MSLALSPFRQLQFSILALLAVFWLGTLGFMMVEADRAPSLLDAAFMTAITLSTVGYEPVWELSDAGRLWSLLVITFGIATVSIAFTSLITLFVSGELRTQREKENMQKRLEALRRHIILCGFGRMGSLIAKNLARLDRDFAVIELNEGYEPTLKKMGVPHIIGDATDDDILMQAGLDHARALISVLPHDADNVFITLTANTICPSLKIVARAEQPQTENKLKRAGAARVICPQIIGATRIMDILERPNVVDFVDVAAEGVHLEMDEYIVSEHSALVGKSLRDARLREGPGAMVVAIKRADGETTFNPGPDVTLDANDMLIIVGQTGMSKRIDSM
ncbi:MAG: potassium channel family protein [Phycisphaerae bacterium]